MAGRRTEGNGGEGKVMVGDAYESLIRRTYQVFESGTRTSWGWSWLRTWFGMSQGAAASPVTTKAPRRSAPGELAAWRVSLQDLDLVAEHDDLDVFSSPLSRWTPRRSRALRTRRKSNERATTGGARRGIGPGQSGSVRGLCTPHPEASRSGDSRSGRAHTSPDPGSNPVRPRDRGRSSRWATSL
jgi:hypothetical protein